MLLYVHVPFCVAKCGYCGFYSEPLGRDPEVLSAYADALYSEVAHWGDVYGRLDEPPVITSLYLGGGTPTLLPGNVLAGLVARLKRAFRFEEGFEFSSEANPESLGRKEVQDSLVRAGVNRLSVGVQSFDDGFLRVLGRCHTGSQARHAIMAARMAGITNISLDLIFGLPGQRLKLWLDDLRAAVDLKPEHLSCYGLTLEEGTPLERAVHAGEIEVPGENEQSRMFLTGADFLEGKGYLQYEVSNFARMGFLCRHNQGYWEGTDYIGLGPSAVSTVGGRRWANPASLKEYARLAAEGRFGRTVETMDTETRVRELVMLRLRTSRGLRLKSYKDLTGVSFLAEHKQLIEALHKNDLIRMANGYLRLSRPGMLVSNAIIEHFFSNRERMLAEGESAYPVPDGLPGEANEAD